MGCIICLEDLEGTETSAEAIWCHCHATHSECLFDWCQNKKLSITSTKCVWCGTYLAPIQQEKLTNYHAVFQGKMCDLARQYDIKMLKTFLNQKRLWSAECFVNLVRTALVSSSLRILRYLRHIAGQYAPFLDREKLVIELFSKPTEMNVRWILNIFDENFQVPQINSEADFLDLMQTYSRFPELLWTFRANYRKFPESAQFQYMLAIYRAHKSTLFEYRDSGIPFFRCRTDYSWILFNIAVKYKENCCHVMSRSLPYAILKEFDPTDARLGIQRLLMERVNSCPMCKGSHIPDAILLAIQEQDVQFLRYLLVFFPSKTKPPIPTVDLSQLLLKLDRRKEIMKVLEEFRRWKGVKKLKRLYDLEIRNSRKRIRFWGFLVGC